jgi:hypothetical protein
VDEEDAAWERLATGWREATAAFCQVSSDQGRHAFLTYTRSSRNRSTFSLRTHWRPTSSRHGRQRSTAWR